MNKNKCWVSSIVIMIMLLAVSYKVQAVEPYAGYNYNAWGESVPSPNGYLPEKLITAKDMGVEFIKDPKDLFVDANDNIYLADTGNNRIIILDNKYSLKKILDTFSFNGKEEKLNNPHGVYVTDEGLIYICDYGNARVLASDIDGNIQKVFGKPDADIFPQHLVFKPLKVLAGKNEIYVLADGLYYGAIIYDMDGKFQGYYGSNRVNANSKVLSDFFWKKILTKEQKSQMARYVPIEYSNFDFDNEYFVYTTTVGTESDLATAVKKMNTLGVNILSKSNFNISLSLISTGTSSTLTGNTAGTRIYGDLEKSAFKGKRIFSQMIDINVDQEGYINCLDNTRGRVFQYDQETNLIFAFGGIGTQLGTFRFPVAIENINGKILILDSYTGDITVFGLTEFGRYIHEAVNLYNDGRYSEALGPWQEVLKRNSNYELAYQGIGKALHKMGNFKEAMKYAKLGYDKTGHTKAFKEYRKETVRDKFSLLIALIILIIAGTLCLVKRKALQGFMNKFKQPRRVKKQDERL